jgi:predicted nucleic acid-binding protein
VNRLVLVDTSVFVDFFRGKADPAFEAMVNDNRVALSEYVRLELALGVRKSEQELMTEALGGLKLLGPHPGIFASAHEVLAEARPKELTIGTIDLLIAAEARLRDCSVYSHDRVFKRLGELGAISVFEA